MWGFPTIDSLMQDVRYGVRQVRRAPVFTLVAVLSLAIGIGASAAVFSLADAALFRTLAVRDPGSLVVIRWTSGPVFPFSSLNGYGDQTASGLASTSFSQAAFRSFQTEAARYLNVLGFADLYQVNVSVDGRAELGTAHAVSGNYFEVLGVAPAAGRPLGPIDDVIDADPAAVVSDHFWRERLGSDPAAVGRTVAVNGVPFTVVGILPAGFPRDRPGGDRPGRLRAALLQGQGRAQRRSARRPEFLVGADARPARAWRTARRGTERARRAAQAHGRVGEAEPGGEGPAADRAPARRPRPGGRTREHARSLEDDGSGDAGRAARGVRERRGPAPRARPGARPRVVDSRRDRGAARPRRPPAVRRSRC